MAVKKIYRFDPVLIDYIGKTTGDQPTTAKYGDLFLCTDDRQTYIWGSTGGWTLWQSMYST